MNPSGTPALPTDSTGRPYLAAAIVAFAFFIGLAWLDRQIAAQLASDLEWTEHTLAVQAKIRAIGALVSDMEAGERGYLLVGTPAFMQVYVNASTGVDDAIAEGARLTSDNAVQSAHWNRLTDLVTQRRAELQRFFNEHASEGAKPPTAPAFEKGRELTAAIRATLREMEQEEARLYAQRKAAEVAVLERNAIFRNVFTLLVGLLLAVSYYLVRREMGIRAKSERGLAEANAQLEAKVLERTHKLEESQARVQGIINSATDAIISIDEDEKIVLANPAAREMFRCSNRDMEGMPLETFIPERYRGSHHEHVRAFAESGVATRRMSAARVVTGLRADGEEFPLDASISQLLTGKRKLFTVILRDITEAQQAKDRLEQSHDELRELSAALESAQEQERKRIARELHDDLGQQLTALRMDVHFVKSQIDASQSEVMRSAERLERMINETVRSVRRISADLRPMMLDDLGLVAALEELATQVCERSQIVCSLVAAEDIRIDEALATQLYRIAQESINNIVKHAEATEATISLTNDEEGLLLTIEDNGKGMGMEDRRKRKSFGLIGMRERVHTIGGDLSIHSRPMAGTRVEVHVPHAVVVASSPAPVSRQ